MVTKKELVAQVEALTAERNKLCKRIDELTLPQHKELQAWLKEKQEFEDFIENTEEEISCAIGLATIGYNNSSEFNDLELGSLFHGIISILTKEAE